MINNKMTILYNYIPLLKELVLRDLRIKYRKSFFGYLWSLMNPLMMMCILTIVFSQVFRFDLPNYSLYLIIRASCFNFVSVSNDFSNVWDCW